MSAGVVIAILVAGGIGAVLRYLAGALAERGSAKVPWAVFTVNTVGSFIAGMAATAPIGEELQLIVIVGFAGGLTTFSTFSVETAQLITEEHPGLAIANIAANFTIGISAAGSGWWLGSLLA